MKATEAGYGEVNDKKISHINQHLTTEESAAVKAKIAEVYRQITKSSYLGDGRGLLVSHGLVLLTSLDKDKEGRLSIDTLKQSLSWLQVAYENKDGVYGKYDNRGTYNGYIGYDSRYKMILEEAIQLLEKYSIIDRGAKEVVTNLRRQTEDILDT